MQTLKVHPSNQGAPDVCASRCKLSIIRVFQQHKQKNKTLSIECISRTSGVHKWKYRHARAQVSIFNIMNSVASPYTAQRNACDFRFVVGGLMLLMLMMVQSARARVEAHTDADLPMPWVVDAQERQRENERIVRDTLIYVHL